MSGGLEPGALERRRSLLRWGLGVGLCISGVVLFIIIFRPREDPHTYFQKFVVEVRTCEPLVRRVTMAYVSTGDGFSSAQRQVLRNEISGLLEPLRSRLQVTDRGIVQRLDCTSAIVPKSPEDLTVLLVERNDRLSLATIHYRPQSGICRAGEVDAAELETIPIRQRARFGLHSLNSGMLRTWAENLPRVAHPDCRRGYPLPGANNVDPRNQRTIRYVNSNPPAREEAR